MAVILVLGLLPTASPAKETGWETFYEKSGFTATPSYAETLAYCRRLDEASPWVRLTSFGTSPQGRELPLLVIDRHQEFDPGRSRERGKIVLLIQAGIHAGEIDGKDAGLMLIRDLVIHRQAPELLEKVTILFMPIFSVDGHERFGPHNRINQNGPEEMGWRTTAQNLNLNRDYLKADAPEMQAWLRLFNDWEPEFFVDCHVTDGSDYQYVVTYAMEIHGNMDAGLTDWTRDLFLSRLEAGVDEAGFPISPYVWLVQWPDPTSGLKSWVADPRLSEGYTALRNCPGLLIETHMLKDYRSRVGATYAMLRTTLVLLNQQAGALRAAVEAARAFTAGPEFRSMVFPLSFEAAPETVEFEFKGIEFETEESEISGGTWIRFGEKPETFRVPYFHKQRPVMEARLPEAYIVPPQWLEAIERLELHGVEVRRLPKATKLKIEAYRLEDVSWAPRPFEGRHRVTYQVQPVLKEREFPAGSVLVDLAQPGARVAAHLLEPQAPDSLVSWGFFNTIFEQKEYAESYVMEKMAREMVREDPGLLEELEKAKAADPEMAGNPRAILNWFYARTPYWDERIGLYPVGRIMDRKVVDSLSGAQPPGGSSPQARR
jgi:murein tripeptide amidase MpaA